MSLVRPGTETCANFGYDWCVHLLCNAAEYYIYFALFPLVINASKRCNCADIFMMGRGWEGGAPLQTIFYWCIFNGAKTNCIGRHFCHHTRYDLKTHQARGQYGRMLASPFFFNCNCAVTCRIDVVKILKVAVSPLPGFHELWKGKSRKANWFAAQTGKQW